MFSNARAADQHGPHLAPSHTTTPDPGWTATLREQLIAHMKRETPPPRASEAYLFPVLDAEDDRSVTVLADITALDPADADQAAALVRSLIESSATQRGEGRR